MSLPEPISALIAALGKLPGIGPRSAERIALHLVQAEAPAVRQLAETMLNARERIRLCSICGALTENELRFLVTRQLRLVGEDDPWAQDPSFLQEVGRMGRGVCAQHIGAAGGMPLGAGPRLPAGGGEWGLAAVSA